MIDKRFAGGSRSPRTVYAHAYSSKFPAFAAQRVQKLAAALSEDRGDRAGVGGKLQFAAPCIDNANRWRKRSRQLAANDDRQRLLAAAPRFPFGERASAATIAFERLHRDRAAKSSRRPGRRQRRKSGAN
jgi:hypothetical protein